MDWNRHVSQAFRNEAAWVAQHRPDDRGSSRLYCWEVGDWSTIPVMLNRHPWVVAIYVDGHAFVGPDLMTPSLDWLQSRQPAFVSFRIVAMTDFEHYALTFVRRGLERPLTDGESVADRPGRRRHWPRNRPRVAF